MASWSKRPPANRSTRLRRSPRFRTRSAGGFSADLDSLALAPPAAPKRGFAPPLSLLTDRPPAALMPSSSPRRRPRRDPTPKTIENDRKRPKTTDFAGLTRCPMPSARRRSGFSRGESHVSWLSVCPSGIFGGISERKPRNVAFTPAKATSSRLPLVDPSSISPRYRRQTSLR